MTKLEYIQKAYGEHWELLQDSVYSNGWISVSSLLEKKFPLMKYIKCEPDDWEDITAYRPLALKGIENNNGWSKIEDGNLPTEDCLYDLYNINTEGCLREESLLILNRLWKSNLFTHYKKSIIIKPPLYE